MVSCHSRPLFLSCSCSEQEAGKHPTALLFLVSGSSASGNGDRSQGRLDFNQGPVPGGSTSALAARGPAHTPMGTLTGQRLDLDRAGGALHTRGPAE